MGPTLFNKGSNAFLDSRAEGWPSLLNWIPQPTIIRESDSGLKIKAFQLFP